MELEAAHNGDTELALDPTTEWVDPTPELAPDSQPSIVTAYNAVTRQLATVNAAITALQVASERRETTTLMLERFNGEWDVLDARLEALAKVAADHDRWTLRPVEKAYERLRKLLERGIMCGQEAGRSVGDLREFLEQLGRLSKRLLVHWDVNQKRQDKLTRRDELTRGEDLSGRQIGEFVLRGRIGEGGFGAVYWCEQPLLEREAVIKVLHSELRQSKVIVQRFMREAKLASRLDHPYAAHVYAFGIEEDDRLLWIAMERVQGVTLAQRLTTHGPMPLEQFVPFFERIAAVVQTAHERGIVHRDLKPSNVMVIERAGQLLPKLLDFGVAKLLDSAVLPDGMPGTNHLPATNDVPPPGRSTVTSNSAVPHPDDGRLTQNSHTIGSPPYISPEQWGNAVTVGPASDLYALAVVAFEALTGRRPFRCATMAEYAELHREGPVPALGGSFAPALDRMFQRALAKRPEDRWGTALELAAALRAASGIGATRSDLPRLDQDVRDAWLAEAPQPLAESLVELDNAHNAYQARDIAEELVRTLLRYLLAITLAMNARAHEDLGDPILLELVRTLDRRALSVDERIRLLRLLVRRLTVPRRAHPMPELLALLTPNPGGTDGLDPILALYMATDHAVTEDAVKLQLMRLLPELTELLRKTTFVLDYVLVVPRNHAAERWAGRRSLPRTQANVSAGELVDGHPMLLDRAGRVCVDLWPLVQAVPPRVGAEPELFVFDRQGHHGALLLTAPSGLEHHDSFARNWLVTHVIAEIENKTRMRNQIRIAAQQWQDRARPNALLWRGEVLADFERWTRHTTGAVVLGDLEASFIAASRRVARRARWIRRSLVAAGVVGLLAAGEYRAAWKTRMAERIAEQAEVEQGRHALLDDDFSEAQRHLTEAYRLGDHSPALMFMLSRALQPLKAEQARLAAAFGRMWSAAFSPDGQRIVTSDDRSARVWDARTNQLLFTLPHGDTVYDARFSTDGARIVTAGGDGTVRIWDAASGAVVHVLQREPQYRKPPRWYLMAMSPDSRFIAAIDLMGEVAHVWDAGTGASVADLHNDASEYPSLAFSADGRWLATSGGNDVRVFDTRTWAQVLTVAGPRVRSLSFDPTGRLATGSARGDASIWEIPSGTRALHLREIGEPIDAMAFSPDGTLVVTASRDGAEQIWDAKSGLLHSQFNALHSKILSAEFDRTSKLIVAAGVSGTVIVADAALGMPVSVLDGPGVIIRTAHFDPTSRRVVGASWGEMAWVWDATPPYRRWSSLPISDDCGLITSLEPDRRFVAIGCRDRNTRIWDTARDKLVAELPSVTPVEGDFASAFPAVDAAGDRAAVARGHTVEVYELPSCRLLRVIRHGAAVNAVAFAPAGHDLVSGATDGSLLVTRDDREPIVLPPSSGGVDAAGFLADGRVVAADALRHLRVYDPEHDAMLAELEMSICVRTLRASPDSRRLLTVPSYLGEAARPLLWDLERYRLVAPLDGHVGQIYGARFVAEGRAIITAGGDGAARLWDGATGQPRATYRGGSRFLVDAAVTPDGSMVVAGGGDGLLRFWDATSGRQLWKLQAHNSNVIGIHFEGDDLVTRGFAGDVSRWTLPTPEHVVEACKGGTTASRACAIVAR